MTNRQFYRILLIFLIAVIFIIIVVDKKIRSNWSCPNNNKIWDQLVYQKENSDGAGTTLHDSDGAGTTFHVNKMEVILLTCSLLLF